LLERFRIKVTTIQDSKDLDAIAYRISSNL
jgi:hypothetical protein